MRYVLIIIFSVFIQAGALAQASRLVINDNLSGEQFLANTNGRRDLRSPTEYQKSTVFPACRFEGEVNINKSTGFFAEVNVSAPENTVWMLFGPSFTANISANTGIRVRASAGLAGTRLSEDKAHTALALGLDAKLLEVDEYGLTNYQIILRYRKGSSIDWYSATALLSILKKTPLGSVAIGLKAERDNFIGPMVEFGLDRVRNTFSVKAWVAAGQTTHGVVEGRPEIRIEAGVSFALFNLYRSL